MDVAHSQGAGLGRRLTVTWLIAAVLSLSACGTMWKAATRDSTLVAAASLDTDILKSILATPAPTGSAARTLVASLVIDSQAKCDNFMATVVNNVIEVHTDADLATTLFSAAATAFKPLSTVHSLSAAATVSSGWKANLTSDIYNQATAINFSLAINSTYYKDVATYLNRLSGIQDSSLNAAFEAAQIGLIHKECNLAAAQATISTSLTPTAAAAVAGINTAVATVTAVPRVGTEISFDGVTPSAKERVKYTVQTGDSFDRVVKGLMAAVQDSFAKAGVVVSTASTPANSFLIEAPQTLGVTWTSADPNLTIVPQKTGGAAQAGVAPAVVPLAYPGHPAR